MTTNFMTKLQILIPMRNVNAKKTHLNVYALLVLLALVILCGCSPQSEPDRQATKETAPRPWLELKTTNARYRVRIHENYGRIPAGRMHYWDIDVMTIDEKPMTPTTLNVSGTMPGHGHGMATFPKASALSAVGKMRVKGMKFHMGGKWRMRLDIVDEAGPDYAYFNFDVQPPVDDAASSVTFTKEELAQLKSLQLSELPELEKDPSNRFSQNTEASDLGRELFFDPGLSRSGTISCATCHDPELGFGDGKVLSVGSAITPRHAPALLGTAFSTWFYWDGRRDSLWSQALSPIETIGEMDSTRGDVLRYVLQHPSYGSRFQKLTGTGPELLEVLKKTGMGPNGYGEGKTAWNRLRPPQKERVNMAFASIGKILAAYEETLLHESSRFDRFMHVLLNEGETTASQLFTAAEIRGAKLYADENKTPCLRCHNGPLFTNQEFHNIDTATNAQGGYDAGRQAGLIASKADPFNCLGVFSDANEEQCTGLTYGRGNHLDPGAFKTPGLRNVINTAPYFHDGRMASLEQVIAHYLSSTGLDEDVHEMPKFVLSSEEMKDLIAFLNTL